MKFFHSWIGVFVTMLEKHAPIKNMQFWFLSLVIMACLNFLMAVLIVILLPFLSRSLYLEQAVSAIFFGLVGYILLIAGKECARRIKK